MTEAVELAIQKSEAYIKDRIELKSLEYQIELAEQKKRESEDIVDLDVRETEINHQNAILKVLNKNKEVINDRLH